MSDPMPTPPGVPPVPAAPKARLLHSALIADIRLALLTRLKA